MSRLRFVLSMLVIGALSTGLLLGQDKKADKETIVVTVKLPTNYSKLGLSAKQRKDILKVRGEYAAKMEELKRQMAELKQKETAECEKFLTDAQKSRLRELTPGGAAKEKPSEVKDKPDETKKK